MDTKLLNIFYQAVKLSYQTTLNNGDILIALWKIDNKIGVSVLCTTSDDTKTIEYCNIVTEFAEYYEFINDIHIEPASWKYGDGDPLRWMQTEFQQDIVIRWKDGNVYVSKGIADERVVKQ